MSEKRYLRACDFCGKSYMAKSKKSRFDTDKCRADFYRARQKMAAKNDEPRQKQEISDGDQKQESAEMSLQSNGLGEVQAEGLKNIYTDTDVWILMAKLCQANISHGTDLLAQLHFLKIKDSLILDFEKRFSCDFDEVVEANPTIKPGQSSLENQAIVDRYGRLKYSR